MQPLKILNTREKKELSKLIEERWLPGFKLDYEVFMSRANKLYLLNREAAHINMDELRINSLGLYFGELCKGELRLSIEGAQLIGRTAKKNVLALDAEQAKRWMAGEDIEVDSGLEGFVIVKYKNDFMGCGKLSNKKLYNYVPKERRVI